MQAPLTQAEREELFRELVRVNTELAARPDNFYTSLEASWRRYGSLTERQEAALVRSFASRAERAAARAQEAAAVTSPVPTGRVTITGTVLSVKWQDSYFGNARYGRNTGSYKMLVRSDAGWKVYGTVASDLGTDGLKGCRVTFTAKIEPKEAAFGFFSRPTGARRLDEAQPEAAPAAAPLAAPAPIARVGLAGIIAKAKELEEAHSSRAERAAAWDTDSMTEAA